MFSQSPNHTFKCALVVLLWGIFFSPSGACQTNEKKLHVVILAVSQFDDTRWSNARLELSIADSSKHLKSYFEEHFKHAEIHLLDTKGRAEFGPIVDFMQYDFPKFANGSVTLFFVLSHGIPEAHLNPNYDQDLLIATSETDKSTHTKAISVAKNLVPAFTSLDAPGSVVLVFLDTCYSGAALNLFALEESAKAWKYGLRIMIMASSPSDARTYRATMSEALLDLWKAQGSACTNPQQAPDRLKELIIKRLGPESIEGSPQLVIPYSGQLCLESFSAQRGLFVFFNARNDTVRATIQSNGKPIDNVSFPLQITRNDVLPYTASREHYTVVLRRKDDVPLGDPIEADLVNEPIDIIPIGPANNTQIAIGLEKAATYAAEVGLSSKETIRYQKAAFAALASAQDENSAMKVAYRINALKPEDSDLKFAQTLAFPPQITSWPIQGRGYWTFWVSALSVLLILSSLLLWMEARKHPKVENLVHRMVKPKATSPIDLKMKSSPIDIRSPADFSLNVAGDVNLALPRAVAKPLGTTPLVFWTVIIFGAAILVSVLYGFSRLWSKYSVSPPRVEAKLEVEQGPASLARIEKLAGRFDKAADLYAKAATLPPKSDVETQKLAVQAYFAYGASGQLEKAKQFRTQHHLVALEQDCPNCIQQEQAALEQQGQGVARQQFSSLCTVRALSNVDF